MVFNWINIWGAIIVLMLLIPNIVYAFKNNNEPKVILSKGLIICEQIGLYGCIILMWLPLFVCKFGFTSIIGLLSYLILNTILMIIYYVFWFPYFKKKILTKSMLLAIIPSIIFFVSGVLLRHWALVIMSIIFAYAHNRIFYITNKG